MALIFRRNFDDELDRETGTGACTCAHPSPEELEARIEAAKQDAYQTGLEAGHTKALEQFRQEANQDHIDTMQSIKDNLRNIFEKSDSHNDALEAQVLDFGLSICEQVFPYLLHNQSQERAVTQIKKTMRMALDSPYINITISETALPQVKLLIEEAAQELGLENQVKLLPDLKLTDGSTRIEWKNGFMEYNFEMVCERILTALKAAQAPNLNPLANGSEVSV
jgi:flagellar assembly protein FliH